MQAFVAVPLYRFSEPGADILAGAFGAVIQVQVLSG